MTIRELIQDLQRIADSNPLGGDAEVTLFDRSGQRTLRVDPGTDTFDFEVMRGDGEAVIEFD